MKPVFREEMDFLGISSNLENYLWVDSRCYYGFDREHNKVKFGRSLEKLPKETNGLMTHKGHCDWYFENYTVKKVEVEREKLDKYLSENKYDELIISVSGGKDSTVVEHMVRGICEKHGKVRVLFGNTSNETHYTYRYVKQTYGNKLEICNPKEGFYNWVKETGIIPTKQTRACCGIFKEGSISSFLDDNKKILQLCGIRRSESKTRSEYEQVKINTKWNIQQSKNWKFYFPIIEFDDMDIWAYLIYNDTKFNQLYKFGYNRVGCTNCCYRSDYELKLNHHFLKHYDDRWKKILTDIFIKNGIAININCTLEEFLNGAWRSGLVRVKPTDEVIQDFANHKNISFDEAKKWFKTNRCSCGKRLSKDMIALNMKLLGRNTNGRMCLKCLSEFLGTTKKELKQQIQEFKEQGCKLF